MLLPWTALLLLGALMVPLTLGQLLLPSGLPSVSSNFKLRAHATSPNTTFGLEISNWQLSMQGDDACSEFATLTKPTGTKDKGERLFVNVETMTIQSERDGRNRTLVIEVLPNERKPLKLECGEESLSQVGIGWKDYTPVLMLERDKDSQFYACDDGKSNSVQVLYRQRDTESLPKHCADIDLVLECASGPDHGAVELAACCTEVKDGECVFPKKM